MTKKRTLLVLLCILCLTVPMLTTGCGSDKKVTKERYLQVMKDFDMEVDDQTESAGGSISSYVGVAYVDGEYQVEYYTATSTENATKIYNYLKDSMENNITGSTKSTTKEIKNVRRYMRSNDQWYVVLSQNEETVVYVTATKKNEEKAKEILKALEE